MKITKIPLEVGGRMIRMGFGEHGINWFFRIDLWNVGYRITKK